MARASDQQIKLVRDSFLEAYVRRMPVAKPDPDTSIFAALEACAAVLANLLTPEAEAALQEFLDEDRVTTVRPAPDPSAYEPILTPDGEPNPERPDEWPCLERAKG